MSKKIVVLRRRTNVLEVFDENDDLLGFRFVAILNVTHLKARAFGWYDVYHKDILVGFVSNVKEVKEKW